MSWETSSPDPHSQVWCFSTADSAQPAPAAWAASAQYFEIQLGLVLLAYIPAGEAGDWRIVMSYRPTWATVKKLVLQTDEDVAQLVVASLGSSLSSMVAHISNPSTQEVEK